MDPNNIAWSLSIVLPLLLDLLGGVAAIWIGVVLVRRKRPEVHTAALALSSACCIAVLGFGFALQPVFAEIFEQSDGSFGHVYSIEFFSATFLSNKIYAIIAGGFLPGSICAAILINLKNRGSILIAAVIGASVLIANDVAKYSLTDFILGKLVAQIERDPLPFSILCDIAGGAIGGVICRWIVIEAVRFFKTRKPARRLIKSSAHFILFAAALTVVSAIFYMVFVRPTSIETILALQKNDGLVVRYVQDTNEVFFKAAVGSLEERLRYTHSWQLPEEGTSISGLGTRPFNMSMRGFGEGGPIAVSIVGTEGCDTADEAISATQFAPQMGQVSDWDAARISLIGSIQSLNVNFPNKDDQALHLIIPDGSNFSYKKSSDGGRIFGFPFSAQIDIPLSKGAVLAFTAMPDWLRAPDQQHEFPSRLIDAENTALVISARSGTRTLSIPRVSDTENTCRVTRFVSRSMKEGNLLAPISIGSNYIIVRVLDSQPKARISVALRFQSVTVAPGAVQLPASLQSSRADFIRASVLEGTLSMGAVRYELRPNDTVILAGDAVDLSEGSDGQVVVRGKTRYVLLNGTHLNVSMWTSFGPEMKGLWIAAFIGGLTYVGRKHLAKIIRRIKA